MRPVLFLLLRDFWRKKSCISVLLIRKCKELDAVRRPFQADFYMLYCHYKLERA